ncbi:MAG: hypothetical protein GX639_16830 [Fibrobacter sp.]|nr:hypothetical protein [Fibrobacter sp.]
MNKKAKFSGRARQFFYSVLGSTRTKSIISLYYRKKFRKKFFSFPVDPQSIDNVLVVLPESTLEILYQLKNILSMMAIFTNAKVTALCPDTGVALLKMIPELEIVEYPTDDPDRFIVFSFFKRQFKNNVDICILLDRTPDIAKVSFVVSTNAQIRAGYKDTVDFPFLNLKVGANPDDHYLPQRNCMMAEKFGKGFKTLKFSVSKNLIDEVECLLKEQRISYGDGLIGVDALYFLDKYGQQWFLKLVALIKKEFSANIYCYLFREPSQKEVTFFTGEKIRCITPLVESRLAALVTKTSLIVSSNSVFYGLGAMFGIKAIGFFNSDDYKIFCPGTRNVQGVIYDEKTDEQCLVELCTQMKHMMEPTAHHKK